MAKANRTDCKLWKRRLKNWKSSELSGVVWCRNNNIPYHMFVYWKKKLGKQNQRLSDPISQDSFIEIPDKQGSTGSGIEIEIQGAVIRISKDFDVDTLICCFNAIRRNHVISNG